MVAPAPPASTASQRQLESRCDEVIEQCRQLRLRADWQPLRENAQLAMELATASGSARRQAQAALLSATAARGLGDNAAAIAAFESAIAAATEANDRTILAIANGNLANALRDTDRIDDALPFYEEALGWEDQPAGRSQIRSNKAQAEALLGDLRQALTSHRQRVADLKASGSPKRDLAIAMDIVASEELGLGAPREALDLLASARALLADDDAEGLAINALQRAGAWCQLDSRPQAATAFEEAWAHARRRAESQLAAPGKDRYEEGLRRSAPTRIPAERALALLLPGVASKGRDRWEQALAALRSALEEAQQAGDAALCLRIEVNVAAVFADAGQVENAGILLDRVRHRAAADGLALAEALATGALGSISVRAGRSFDPLGALGLYARSQALTELHVGILGSSTLTAAEQAWDLVALGTGALDNQLALLAHSYGADAFAAASFERAAARLSAVAPSFELANRLSGALVALNRIGRREDADGIAARLVQILASGALFGRGLLVVHRSLGDHLAPRDLPRAADHYRQACTAALDLRASVPAGPLRSEVNRDFAHLHRTLAHVLRQLGRYEEAYDAIQHDKARRLLDMLALRLGVADSPPTLAAVQARLAATDLLVDLVLYEDGVTAYLVGPATLRCVHVAGSTRALARVEIGDAQEREQALLQLCATDPLLAQLVEAVSAEAGDGARLIVVPDDALHNLPLHVVPWRSRRWCESFPMSYLPAAGVLGLTSQPVSGSTCLVAGDSALNLPGASEECVAVAALLGTEGHVGPECTRERVEETLRSGAIDILHLAVHGRGDPRRGGRASLLLGDDAGGVAWVSFDDLAAIEWRANLVILSGCSTGVAGPRAGHELQSVARAAIEAGAASVLACLWPVDDAVARAFMLAFHTALARDRARGPVDLRMLVAEAQSAVQKLGRESLLVTGRRRDGRKAAQAPPSPRSDTAFLAAPFVLSGRPTLPSRR